MAALRHRPPPPFLLVGTKESEGDQPQAGGTGDRLGVVLRATQGAGELT